MDDEREEISRRRRLMTSSTSFVKTRSTSSCATPRYEWRSISWSAHAPEEKESSDQGEEADSDGDTTQVLCPPLQSLSVSTSGCERGKKVVRKGKNCLDIKLDMGVIEKSVPEEEPSEHDLDMQLGEKVAEEKDKHCTQVLGHLFVGGRSVAQNYALLQTARITHILNCVGLCVPEFYPKEFQYKTLWLHDTPGEDIICVLYDVFDFLENVSERAGCQALVHCSEGVSRSAALVIAYLMWRDRKTFEQAFEQMKSVRSSTNPNLGFVFQLMQWQPRILGHPSKQQPVSIYRMAPQSAYDPLYLVPKPVANPSMESLDSRGCFVVQTPTKLYVWKGRSSDKGMLAAADKFAFQLIRYEHAHGPIVTVVEGTEPPGLLDALTPSTECSSSRGHSGDSADGGSSSPDRLVSIYNTDYEIYSKARAGEFPVPLPGRTSSSAANRGVKSPDTGQSSKKIDTS